MLFAWLSISETLAVFRQKDNLLLPSCVILLTRQTSQSAIFILLVRQTRQASDSLSQIITNHPGSPPHSSHELFSTWNHTLAALPVASVKGRRTTRNPRAVLTHPNSTTGRDPRGKMLQLGRAACAAQISSFGS